MLLTPRHPWCEGHFHNTLTLSFQIYRCAALLIKMPHKEPHTGMHLCTPYHHRLVNMFHYFGWELSYFVDEITDLGLQCFL